MFKDYYQILNISTTATASEIRKAYHDLCKKWHPDVNKGEEATSRMQDINEAYLILKDSIKRARYDVEYNKFNSFKQSHIPQVKKQTNESNNSYNSQSKRTYNYNDYEINDDYVKKDIENARRTAQRYVDELTKSIKESSKKALKSALEASLPYIIIAIIGTILTIILF